MGWDGIVYCFKSNLSYDNAEKILIKLRYNSNKNKLVVSFHGDEFSLRKFLEMHDGFLQQLGAASVDFLSRRDKVSYLERVAVQYSLLHCFLGSAVAFFSACCFPFRLLLTLFNLSLSRFQSKLSWQLDL